MGLELCNAFKKLTTSLEIKLVNITLCKCSWYILIFLGGLAYGVNEGFSIVGEMFQVNPLET